MSQGAGPGGKDKPSSRPVEPWLNLVSLRAEEFPIYPSALRRAPNILLSGVLSLDFGAIACSFGMHTVNFGYAELADKPPRGEDN